MQDPVRERSRLAWQCRRGMRELDLMLLAFLDHSNGYACLDESARQAFIHLLDYPDQVLLEILMGRQQPADTEVADVAQRIRRTAGPDT